MFPADPFDGPAQLAMFSELDPAFQIADLTFPVVPDEIFYLWQKLETSAVRGTRSADAFSTMMSVFDQPNLVESLSFPEPATLGVLAIGGLMCLRRRRCA